MTMTAPAEPSHEAHSTRITFDMTETVHYRRSFTVAELATILGCEPTRAAVVAHIDSGNATYCTKGADDASILNAIVPADNPAEHIDSVDGRSWGWSVTA